MASPGSWLAGTSSKQPANFFRQILALPWKISYDINVWSKLAGFE